MVHASRDVGGRRIGLGEHIFIIAEIGINHNGSVEIAKALIDGACAAGVDAVKFQKRSPEKCVPREFWRLERETPWGRMSYIDYRRRMEFGEKEFKEIDNYCKYKGVLWFASCWDEDSVAFMESFDPPCYKISSASVTDEPLLSAVRSTQRPIFISTGMSTLPEIDKAVEIVGRSRLLIAHSTSIYPCPPIDANLRVIHSLATLYPECPIGYSGHEVGIMLSYAAVALGATFIERHITLDRSMWGSDQSASLNLSELNSLVGAIRELEGAFGDGIKTVYPGELVQIKKLRRVYLSSRN
jgi:N-acetylneuraminate synthase